MKITKEIKIGFFTIFALALFIWGLNYLKGEDLLTRHILIYGIYDDVTGLVESNPVSMNGVKIGQVNRIKFLNDGSGRVIVENIVLRNVPIPANSILQLSGTTIMGSREIFVQRGNSEDLVKNGDTLQAYTVVSLQDQVGQQVGPLIEQTENVFARLDSILQTFNKALDHQATNDIKQTFASVRATAENMENATSLIEQLIMTESEKLTSTLTYTESFAKNLSLNNDKINQIINNISSISDSIAISNLHQTLLLAGQTLNSLNLVIQKIEKGEGTLGLLVNDTMLYHDLQESLKQVELLLEDIRNNPGKYINISVFGRR